MTLRKVYKKIRKVIIYEIVCNITGERYIGSTIQRLSKRKFRHKSMKGLCSSRTIIERNNYEMNELETFNSRFELPKLLKEQYYLDNITNINKYRAFGKDINKYKETYKQWQQENKESLANYIREYTEINRKDLYIKRNNYRRNQIINECPCGGHYKNRSKQEHFRTKMHIKYEVFSIMEEMIATLENNLSTIGK